MPRSVAFHSDAAEEYSINCDKQLGGERGKWQNIIFLPFNLIWEILIQFTILINIFITSFQLLQIGDKNYNLNFTYYILELFYATDTILVVMHRYRHYSILSKCLAKHMCLAKHFNTKSKAFMYLELQYFDNYFCCYNEA